MTERDALFLQHVLAAVAEIEEFTAGGRLEFMTDRKTQSATSRSTWRWCGR